MAFFPFSVWRAAAGRRFCRCTWVGPLVLLLSHGSNMAAHDGNHEREVKFSSAVAELAGTLLLPPVREIDSIAQRRANATCVVILGGTLSHTRDGTMVRAGAPPRRALAELAEKLAAGGYASLRFDKVGFGGSRPAAKWTGTYTDEATLAAAAIQYARSRPEFAHVIAAGESAGAYLACLAAKQGTKADGYIFLGGFCGPGEGIYEYNFGGLVRYAEGSPERLAWAKRDLPLELALGKNYKAMFAAAAAGKGTFELIDGDFHQTVDLARRREELRMPPDEMFRYIQAPTLALAGEKDLNVPAEHAERIVSVLRQAGNHNVMSVVIPGADHSFQQVAEDEDQRVRERYSFESFRRPYELRVYREIIAWLDKTLPTRVTTATQPAPPAPAPRALAAAEIDRMTENTPERLFLAPGIQIVEDITDKRKTAGVETLDGRIGPLLLAQGCQAHFLDMPSGMFCAEHPHNTESIIYTVRGQWVLCSQGRRQLMKPGSLFHFAADTPTGYEVPFGQDAYILVFKGERSTHEEKEFIDYLKGMADRLRREQKDGTPFLLKDLPAEHPARQFAERVNPQFNR